MLPERRRSRQARRIGNLVLAAGCCVVLLGVLGAGLGTVPGLGPALDPGHGAWASASGALPARSQSLHLPGLAHPVQVTFTSQGLASIRAQDDADEYLALGYVHARFRLTQMDLERRLGEGRLAQLDGEDAVASDEFELRLGLLRTARREWAQLPKASPAARALTSYSRGVNDYLASLRSSGQWPAMFTLAGAYPASWTPVDSLVVQGDLTQQLDFTTAPLDYELLDRSLGTAATMSWFPVLPAGPQAPYDPGPYRGGGIAPITGGADGGAGVAGGRAAGRAGTTRTPDGSPGLPGGRTGRTGRASRGSQGSGLVAATGSGAGRDLVADSGEARTASEAAARAAAAVLAEVGALSAGQVHEYPDSNAWAANGPKVASGGAMLGGDPHLPQTLPSAWYQAALSAPGLAVSGVTVPGLPGVLIGHNRDVAWSLTDTQDQSVLFYDEQTSKSRPGEYFWRGQWRRERRLRYTIPVRGGAARRLTVSLTVHGPVLTTAGQTVSADWMGALGSPDLAVLLRIDQAASFAQFRAALADWRSPTQNFVYADRNGHIGAISAGYYPVVRHGRPWLPMPGTGADDVAGVIPYADVPHAYDPRGHVIATANQRPVSGSYPYYIGTSANDFDAGYRAATEYRYLDRHDSMSPPQFATLQSSVTDQLARSVLPRLLAALRHVPLTSVQRQARQVLTGWNAWMGPQSPGASIWWTFWSDYLSGVFQPWWTARHVPVHLDPAGLSIGPGQASLDEVLQSWTLHDQRNAAFTPPGSPRRDAAQVMRAAFAAAVAHLKASLGGAPPSWAWGRLHSRRFSSLTQASALGYGPRAAGGDPWTVNAADGGLTAMAGPSWRMIVHWDASGTAAGEGMYPGGQSDNPASPWYANLIPFWWSGRYLPMPRPASLTKPDQLGRAGSGGAAGSAAGSAAARVEWELTP